MSPAAFIDTNLPIYAAGRPHSLKNPCAQILLLWGRGRLACSSRSHPGSRLTDPSRYPAAAPVAARRNAAVSAGTTFW